jgi:hypothetical protein
MPLYEYECAEHGKFEKLYDSPFLNGALKIEDGKLTVWECELRPPKTAPCPRCAMPSPRLVSAHARTPGKWKANA